MLHRCATPGWEKIQTGRQLHTKAPRAERAGVLTTVSPGELHFHCVFTRPSQPRQGERSVKSELGVWELAASNPAVI